MITPYAMKRSHDNATGFYRVNVPEVGRHGLGFQFRWGPWVVGVSLTWHSAWQMKRGNR